MTNGKKKNVVLTLIVAVSSVGLWAIAAENAKEATPKTPAQMAFEQLKQLEGSWKGTASHGGEEAVEAKVAYHVTAAGSAVGNPSGDNHRCPCFGHYYRR